MTSDGYPSRRISLSGATLPAPPQVGESSDTGRFAEVSDLEARWHALTASERERAERLLDDASDLMRTTCPNWRNATDLTLERICCAVVRRAMLASDETAGVSQHTQTAGSYSESFSYSNPDGDLYLTRSEKESLGGDGAAWSYDPITGKVA